MSVENIKRFADRLIQTDSFITKETTDLLNSSYIQNLMAKMNRDQMVAGVNADSTPIGKYTQYSRKLRAEKNLQYSHIDLKQTGAFHQSVKAHAIVSGGEPAVFIDATDPKWRGELGDRFDKALGLTEQNRMIVATWLARNLAKSLRKFWRI